MPRTGVLSGYEEDYEKGGEAWSRYTTATGLTRRPGPFLYELPAAETTHRRSAWNCHAGVKSISETIFEYVVRSTVLFYAASIILRRSLRGFEP